MTSHNHDNEPSEGQLSADALDWRQGTWAVLDLETTGLSDQDRICEIALVMMRWGAIVEIWSSLVNPGISIPPEATAVHGISDEMVLSAPTMAQLEIEVRSRIANADVVVGYNILGFDEAVLKRELPDATAGKPVIDPLVIVRSSHVGKYWKSEPWVAPPTSRSECADCESPEEPQASPAAAPVHGRHKLGMVAARFELDRADSGRAPELHRATWDAILAGRVLWHLREYCGASAKQTELRMRAEFDRQQAEAEAFRARVKAKEASKETQRGLHRQMQARLDELESYCAKLEAKLGQPPFAGDVA